MPVVEGGENDCGAVGGGSREAQIMTSKPVQVVMDWNRKEIQEGSKIVKPNPERPAEFYNRLHTASEERV